MAALNIPARSTSWKALVKRFITYLLHAKILFDASSFREKNIVREIRSIFRESFNIENL